MSRSATVSLGVIIGNRNFFPDQLVADAAVDIRQLLASMGIAAVICGGGLEGVLDALAVVAVHAAVEEIRRQDVCYDKSPVAKKHNLARRWDDSGLGIATRSAR